MQLPSVKVWTATTCIQAGWVASSPGLWRRTPQRTIPAGITPPPMNGSTNAASPAPLIVYPSESTLNHPTQDSLSSPLIKSPSIILAALAGAGAISAITLTVFFIYRKVQTGTFQNLGSDCGSSNDQFGVKKGRSKVEKGTIRRITHEEQRERYKSLFGVPAGYLRPKSEMTYLEPRPLVPSRSTVRYSEYLPDSQTTMVSGNYYSMHSSADKMLANAAPPSEITTIGSIEREAGRERKRGVIRFDEETSHKIHQHSSQGDPRKYSSFSQRLPSLSSKLRVIKDRAMYKGQPTNQPHTFSRPNLTDSIPIQTDVILGETDVPRSPSIVPTPPSYLKSPYQEKTSFELGVLVTERLESNMSAGRTSFEGRGDSYYWKVSPVDPQSSPNQTHVSFPL